MFAHIIGSIFVFFLIKFVNRIVENNDCLEMSKMTGWYMFLMTLMSWLGLIAYITYEIMAFANAAQHCKDKNQLYSVIYKINELVEKVFK